MEWGLRKVLPKLTDAKKSNFIRHIMPVITELCRSALSEEEFEELLQKIREATSEKPEEPDETAETDNTSGSKEEEG